MAKAMQTEGHVLWKDKKRMLGMPISFTWYAVEDDRFTTRVGFLSSETNEMLLYRILDIRMNRSLWQKIFGVGTITLYTADQSHKTFEIKNIKHPDKVRRFLSRAVEQARDEKGVSGREIVGAAGMMAEGGGAAPFIDIDGDGIPD